MTQAVPVEQLRSEYVVFVGDAWPSDLVTVTRPVGSTVAIDGVDLSAASFVAIDDGLTTPEWEVARVPIADGRHEISGSHRFGVTVAGYSGLDSYAFPGGMNLLDLDPVVMVPTMSPNHRGALTIALTCAGVAAIAVGAGRGRTRSRFC